MAVAVAWLSLGSVASLQSAGGRKHWKLSRLQRCRGSDEVHTESLSHCGTVHWLVAMAQRRPGWVQSASSWQLAADTHEPDAWSHTVPGPQSSSVSHCTQRPLTQ